MLWRSASAARTSRARDARRLGDLCVQTLDVVVIGQRDCPPVRGSEGVVRDLAPDVKRRKPDRARRNSDRRDPPAAAGAGVPRARA